MGNIRNILYDNEKVLWEGRPERAPYLAGAALVCIPLFFFGLAFAAIPLFMAVSAYHGGQKGFAALIFLMPHFWVGIGIMFGPYICAYLSYSRTSYAITDKRVLIETGVISQNITALEYSMISDATVRVSAVDNWYGLNTGTIIISSTGARLNNGKMRPTSLCNIKDPYGVFKFFEKLELDVKTDIEYPNAMRPAVNPGYQTQIERDPKA